MALINCKECGYEMSTNADSCPNCGNKKEKNFYHSYWNWVFVTFNIYYLNVISGIPIVFSITLAGFLFMAPFLNSDSMMDKFFTEEGSLNYKYIFIYFLSILSVIVCLIIYVYQLFTLLIGNEKYFYDLIYEFKEVFLGLFFLLPLLGSAFLYYRDRFNLDGVPSNPYTPLEDKNLLIQNIIELSGKTSWENDLEKLDIEALNDIHEKLSRHANE